MGLRMQTAMRRTSSPFRALICVLAVFLIALLSSHAPTKYPFDLPAQPLAESLRAVGHQTSTNVMFEPRLVKGLDAPALRTETTPAGAIHLLLAHTELTALQTAADTILIQRVSAAAKSAPTGRTVAAASFWDRLRLAQVDQGPSASGTASGGTQASNEPVRLEEIIVTAQKREERAIDVPISIVAL